MTLIATFRISIEDFALYETLRSLPETVIQIERVVASNEVVTPYFWVRGTDLDVFESIATEDSSVHDLHRLDEFNDASLFRAEWTENVESVVYAYTHIGATILDATGHGETWELDIRFDEHDELPTFREYCANEDIRYRLIRLHEVASARTGSQYGLTPKQVEALTTAWELGYFTDADVTLTDVAVALSITQQSVSERLHRGYDSLIENTLVVAEP